MRVGIHTSAKLKCEFVLLLAAVAYLSGLERFLGSSSDLRMRCIYSRYFTF